jgi:hypothetical protein
MQVSLANDGPVTLIIDSVKDEKAVKKLELTKKREEK